MGLKMICFRHELYFMIIKFNGKLMVVFIPKNPFFDGFNNRTAQFNKSFELIYKLGEGFSENKNVQTGSNFDLSTSVNRIGFEPTTLPTINRDALSS